MDKASVQSSYKRYAGFYDYLFGPSLSLGRRQTFQQMDWSSGQRVLEIGIGTGLSIPFYPSNVQLTGIDLCEPMLARARIRAERYCLKTDLRVMNAEHLDFGDDVFDQTLALYVASVTPHPAAMVAEMRRVTRPDGTLYILNHFSRKNSALYGLEKVLKPLASVIGFEPVFFLDEFQAQTGLTQVEDIPIRPFGYWRLLRVKNIK